ncbi:sugar phosphate isomerase/epimerase [Sphingomonas sp. RP10(2022)]|uniref:Sugar phosphate isomerase/epimerase n=1 Tax=Sphingomonas liriopis TaxID=2949094 RepID=A0A9X2KN59_9SPHN|nr:sugar phosphate isomerase/epimerase [Sphingomonas liriopis]MCP3733314.1 sugar phosphate isomerase/epimerase [Sphingomonas liriopis]
MPEVQFTRRSSLAAMAGASVLMATSAWGAGRSRSLFNLDDRPLGIQLYTLNGEFTSDPEGMFQALSRIGYRRFECDLERMAKPGFRAAAARHGLSCNSVHLNPMALENDADFPALIERARAAGVRFAGVSIFPFSPALLQGNRDPIEVALSRIAASKTLDDWRRIADLLNRRGAAFRQAGIRLYYHNHNVEFRRLEGTTPFAVLMKHTDPGSVSFELDVGWVAAAGLDPVAVIAAHPGRFRLMHVKDIKKGTAPNYEMKQIPAEVGSGSLDWPKLIGAARRAGITEFFVEQEPPFARPRIEAAEISAKYLLGLRA